MDFKSQRIQMLLTLRLQQLRKKGMTGITIHDLEWLFERLAQHKAKRGRISELADLIFSTSDDDIVRYMALFANQTAYYQTLDDFSELIVGDDDIEK